MQIATLDVGTGGLHAAVYSEDGRLLADRYDPIRYSSDSLGRTLEFDPEALFASGMRLIASAYHSSGAGDGGELILAFTSQRHGSVFLDESMEPVVAVANLDYRVGGETGQFMAETAEEVHRLTGRSPSEIFPAARLHWMRSRQPELYRRIVGFLMINEWFAYRTTGVARSELTSVTESLLFDIENRRWSERLRELFGVSELREWELVEPGEIVGTLRGEVAARYGLPPGSQVSLSAGDTQCAAVGSGAFTAGDTVAVNGSTTPVVMVTESLLFDTARAAWTDLYVQGMGLIESNAGKTGMVYRGLTEELSCQDLPDPSPESIYDADALDISAVLLPPPGKPIDFLNGLGELRFRCDPVQLLRLLPYLMIENTAFAIAVHVEEVKRIARRSPNQVFLTGGSSRSNLTQLITSVLLEDCPLYLTGTFDTTSQGAAMLALATATGDPPEKLFPEAPGQVLLPPHEVTPQMSEAIRRRYQRWRERFTKYEG